MKKDFAKIVVILDRSGSMSSIKKDMEEGLRTFVEEQKKVPGTAEFDLYTFDSYCEREIRKKNLSEVEPSDIKLTPRGSTALYDALGSAIKEIGSELDSMKEEDKPEKVIFVIVTDGEENSSREYSGAEIKRLITQQEKEWKWNFIYLGANQDAFKVGHIIGTQSYYTANFRPTGQSINSVYMGVSNSVKSIRCSGGITALNANY